MNIKGIDPYKPCFCGSGKKFRFCCGQTNPFVMPSPEEHAQYFYFLNKGLKFSGELKFEEALPWFKKAMEVTEVIPSATNNLAACLCMCSWLRAQAFYQECKGKKKEAKKLYDSADEIANADI